MSSRVVSREPQATAIAEFLTSVVAAPSALVIEGQPGIGKTTLWLETIERAKADGFRVMAERPVAAESVLAYASLADMLKGVDTAILAELPDPQRVALDRVLLRARAMFISPKTVESNLARIYAKVGIHSRAELGRHVGELNV